MKIRGLVLCTEQHLANTDVSVRTSKLRVEESKQGRGNEYSIPGDISEKIVKHGSHRRVSDVYKDESDKRNREK